jgi:hypothetical protein
MLDSLEDFLDYAEKTKIIITDFPAIEEFYEEFNEITEEMVLEQPGAWRAIFTLIPNWSFLSDDAQLLLFGGIL